MNSGRVLSDFEVNKGFIYVRPFKIIREIFVFKS